MLNGSRYPNIASSMPIIHKGTEERYYNGTEERYYNGTEERYCNTSPVFARWLVQKNKLDSEKTGTSTSLKSRTMIVTVDDQQFPKVSGGYAEGALAVTPDPVTLKERLDKIKDKLGLSVTQIAELFGVTRKTVYDWYEGTEPRNPTAARIEVLIDVLSGTPGAVDLRRLKAVWNVSVSEHSFREIFNDNSLDTGTLRVRLKMKIDELAPRLTATVKFPKEKPNQLGESHLSEFDRRADFS